MDYEDLENIQSSKEEYDISSYFTNETNGDFSNDTSSSVSSFTNKKRKRINNNKNENGSYTITRICNDVHVKIQCFATKSTMGTKIKSATIGTYYENMYVLTFRLEHYFILAF